MMNSISKRIGEVLATIFVVLTLSFSALAQNYSVKPLSDFLQPYKDKHRIILNAIESRDDLTIAQKLILYEGEISKIKEEFKGIRKTEYESKSAKLSVTHSCTSGSKGGVKDCGSMCVNTPNINMYTRSDWIRVDGTNKGVLVSPEGSSACLKMTVAGKGRNVGTLVATFRYSPGRVANLVDQETIDLFNQVVKHP